MSSHVESMIAKYRRLQAAHKKALKKQGEWEGKAQKYGQKVEAFRVVMEEMEIEPETLSSDSAATSVSLKDSLLDIAKKLKLGITVETVRPHLPPAHAEKDPATISSTLIRLWRTDEVLERVEEGRGGKLSVYEWVGDEDEEEEEEEPARSRAVSIMPLPRER